MDEKVINKIIRKITFIIIGIILFACVLFKFEVISGVWENIMRVSQPFLVGILIALLLNAPVKFFERKLTKKDKDGNEVTNKKLAVILSLLCVIIVLAIVVVLVIPELINFGKVIVSNAPIYGEKITEIINNIQKSFPDLNIEDLSHQITDNIENIGNTLSEQLPTILSNSMSSISSTITGIVNFFIGIGFAITCLINKDRITKTIKAIAHKYINENKINYITKVINIFTDNFSNFVIARSINSFAIGILCIIISAIVGIPSAIPVGILLGVTSLIPIFGGIIGIVIAMIMIVAIAPIKALIFFIIGMIIWQLGENMLVPYFIGKKMEMSDFLQFVVVTAGSAMFGILGIVIGIPAMNTLYSLLTEKTNLKKTNKESK